MRAVTCSEGQLDVTDVPDPEPEEGQVLLDVVATGICGSDLHARHHADELADASSLVGYDRIMRPHESVIMGHEFSGRIVAYGPRIRRRLPADRPVVAMPLLRRSGQAHLIGLSAHAPGGYAERVLVQESLMFPVPEGLDPRVAALTEPMAVALHAVRRSEAAKRRVAVVGALAVETGGLLADLRAEGGVLVALVVAQHESCRPESGRVGRRAATDARVLHAGGGRGVRPSVHCVALRCPSTSEQMYWAAEAGQENSDDIRAAWIGAAVAVRAS